MSAAGDVVRPVGMLEKFYPARQVLGIYNSVIVTATYTVPPKLEDRSLYAILCAVIPRLLHRHPSLSCYVEGVNTPRPNFKPLQTIEVNEVLQVLHLTERESLAQKLQELHDQQWSTALKPLWKLVIMRGPQITSDDSTGSPLHAAFVFHHVIGDGLSGMAFHKSLLRELGNIEQGSERLQEVPTAIDTPTHIRLIDPVEKLTKLPLSWWFLIQKVVQEYAPRWLMGAAPPPWAGLPVQTLDKCPLRTRVRVVSIQADQLATLLEESKKRRVTLTSLITAAVVTTLAKALPEAPSFFGITPYTLRRVTGTSMDEMVNQSTVFETSYPADLLDGVRKASTATEQVETLWTTASYFHAQLKSEIARCPHDNLIGLLPYLSDYVEFYQKQFGKARAVTFELSNLGAHGMPQEALPGIGRLEDMTFTQGAQPVGAAITLNAVSIEGGPLNIAITWQESVVHEGIVDTLARYLTDLPRLLQHQH